MTENVSKEDMVKFKIISKVLSLLHEVALVCNMWSMRMAKSDSPCVYVYLYVYITLYM